MCESLRASRNAEELHILIVDAVARDLPKPLDGIRFVCLDELDPKPPEAMRHYFDAFELCCALKPFLITHLMRGQSASEIIYLDSDILVTGSFETVWSRLREAPLLLTPHHLQPPLLGTSYIREADIADLGILNGGFAAWRAGPQADRILAWMHERFPIYGFCDRPNGMFVDQKLLPLLLEYFPEDVLVLRDPALNIAYWNACERPVRYMDGKWRVGERPVVFFHMSGFSLNRPDIPCAYLSSTANRDLLKDARWLGQVTKEYAELLAPLAARWKTIGYGYGRYDNVTLNQGLRRMLFRKGRLDRMDPIYWRIRIIGWLRAIKRQTFGKPKDH